MPMFFTRDLLGQPERARTVAEPAPTAVSNLFCRGIVPWPGAEAFKTVRKPTSLGFAASVPAAG